MSEHTLQDNHDRHYESQETLHQSAWMAQRTRTSWNSASVVHSSFARHDKKEENHERMLGTLLDADICAGTSEPDFTSRLLELGPTEEMFSSKDTCNQTGSILQNPAEWPLKSSTHLVEESDPNSSRVTFKEQFIETNFTSLERDCCNSANSSSYLFCDKKKDKQPLARNSERIYGSLYSRQKGGALRINDISTSKIYIQTSVENSTHKFSCTPLSPCHCSHTGETKLEELNNRYHFLHRMPTCSVHDVETPTMRTTIGSMKGVHGAPPVSSQPTQQYLNTNNTDVDVSEGKHLTRVPVLSTNFKSDAFHKLHSLPSRSDSHDRWVPKLQALGNSSGSEGVEDTGNVKNSPLSLMNKSLAGTDIMDISISPARNTSLGVAAYPSCKDFMVGKSPAKSQATVAFPSEKVRSRKAESNLFDMKQDVPSLLAAEDSIQKKGLNTTLTQTLDVEHLYSHVEKPDNLNLSYQQDIPSGILNSSWVKRLKLGASYSPNRGRETSKLGDVQSGDRVNELYCKAVDNNSRVLEEGQMKTGRNMAALNSRDSSSLDMEGKCQHLNLSHPWIQRWCHKGQRMKPRSHVICELESLRATMDEFKVKQFPSIAALALMGKATSSLPPCEVRKKGPVVVWNLEDFQ